MTERMTFLGKEKGKVPGRFPDVYLHLKLPGLEHWERELTFHSTSKVSQI